MRRAVVVLTPNMRCQWVIQEDVNERLVAVETARAWRSAGNPRASPGTGAATAPPRPGRRARGARRRPRSRPATPCRSTRPPRRAVRLDQTPEILKKANRQTTSNAGRSRRRMGTKGPWRQGRTRQELYCVDRRSRVQTPTEETKRMTVDAAGPSQSAGTRDDGENRRDPRPGPSRRTHRYERTALMFCVAVR